MAILDEVQKQVESMDAEALKAEFARIMAERETRKAKQVEYNTKPEVKAKRLEYTKVKMAEYKADPVKFAAMQSSRKEYMLRPEVKARQKEYRDKRNLQVKAILARAKELGVELGA
jgi:hypothetical protein